MSLIFLIGMPAAGKSYLAEEVAHTYNIGLIDLDVYIEQREQTSVADLFSTRGETGFREAEHEALKEIIQNDAEYTVVACGGGTPCHHNNMFMMQQGGVVVYLQAPIELLLARLQADSKMRPLLARHPDVEGNLRQLLAQREPVYLQADYILPTEDNSLITFEQILKQGKNKF
jgi:shikimate kinase